MQTELLKSGEAVILSSPPAESPTGAFVPVLPGAPLCFDPDPLWVGTIVSICLAGSPVYVCADCPFLVLRLSGGGK